MEKMLEQLYKGELYPYSKFQTTIEDLKVNRDKAFKSYSVFIEKLPDEVLTYKFEQDLNELIKCGERILEEHKK